MDSFDPSPKRKVKKHKFFRSDGLFITVTRAIKHTIFPFFGPLKVAPDPEISQMKRKIIFCNFWYTTPGIKLLGSAGNRQKCAIVLSH